jgi:propionyl-CoA carboxylase beta chain
MVEQIIEPKDTRPAIISALNMLKNKKVERPYKKHGNIPL